MEQVTAPAAVLALVIKAMNMHFLEASIAMLITPWEVWQWERTSTKVHISLCKWKKIHQVAM